MKTRVIYQKDGSYIIMFIHNGKKHVKTHLSERAKQKIMDKMIEYCKGRKLCKTL